ncbi:ras-specific guanine nucleotide-releasing factor 1 isoform 1 [Planoprotostelium fungivorum]|uniref:Ras-specific guanine nucleotide-releasing factor 1 isoform 1 n=1 Tax=Planoprotostelium fungivorum TaxID=1890364 RepID=A0A2P6NQM3_9EUKA|nr:ras-specific guanine nucleotide-releasing factor 1 isoform 1 [Planoprotostelium fungivorum]
MAIWQKFLDDSIDNPAAMESAMDFLLMWFNESFRDDFSPKDRLSIVQRVDEFPCRKNELKLLFIRLANPSRLIIRKMKSHRADSIATPIEPSRPTSTSSTTPNDSERPLNEKTSTLVTSAARMQKFNSKPRRHSTNLDLVMLPATRNFTQFSQTSRSRSGSFRVDTIQMGIRNSKLLPILRYTPEAVGDALTLRLYDEFRKMKGSECMVKMNWDEGKRKTKSIDDLTATFNQISDWVKCCIVTETSRAGQTEIIERMIRTAKRCDLLGNFEGCMAVVSGLNHYVVQRLKGAWINISERDQIDYDDLDAKMSPGKNFARYRAEVVERVGPRVPLLGLLMRDFTFVNENRAYTEEGEVNFDTIKLIENQLAFLWEKQSHEYEFYVDPRVLNVLKCGDTIMSDEQLYEASLSTEPALWQQSSFESYDGNPPATQANSAPSSPVDDSGKVKNRTLFWQGVRISRNRQKKVILSPEAVGPLEQIEGKAKVFFNSRTRVDIRKGIITISDFNSLLLRASSLQEMGPTMLSILRDELGFLAPSRSLEGHNYHRWMVMGRADAEAYCDAFGLIELKHPGLAGAIFTSYLGWSKCQVVEYYSDYEDMFLKIHLSEGGNQHECASLAGYLSGWMTSCYGHGRTLVAVEITCNKKYSTHPCTFIVAPSDRIEARIQQICQQMNMSEARREEVVNLQSKPMPIGRHKTKIDERTKSSSVMSRFRQPIVKPPTKAEVFEDVPAVWQQCLQAEEQLYGSVTFSPARIHYPRRSEENYVLMRMQHVVDQYKSNNFAFAANLVTATRVSYRFSYEMFQAVARSDLKHLSLHGLSGPHKKLYFMSTCMRHGGWGKLAILPSTSIALNSKGRIERTSVRCELQFGSESQAWMDNSYYMLIPGSETNEIPPCCHSTAGYISGWISEALGCFVDTVEITCRVRGDDRCSFITCSRSELRAEAKSWLQESKRGERNVDDLMGIWMFNSREEVPKIQKIP